MARNTGKIQLNRYHVEPCFWGSASFGVSICPRDRIDYVGRSV